MTARQVTFGVEFRRFTPRLRTSELRSMVTFQVATLATNVTTLRHPHTAMGAASPGTRDTAEPFHGPFHPPSPWKLFAEDPFSNLLSDGRNIWKQANTGGPSSRRPSG